MRTHYVPPLTIDALAKKSRVSVNTVSTWLNGKTWPQPAKLEAIEKALDLPVGTLDRVGSGEVPDVDSAAPDDSEATARMVVGFAPGVLDHLTPAQLDEARTAAKLAALRAIREMTAQDGGGA